MTRKWFVIAAAILALPFALSGRAEDKKAKSDDKDIRELMHRKLVAAQRVLEGVTTKDFDIIAKNADELLIISKAAEWKVLKSPQYELYSNEFRRTADTMAKAAREKNLDGAALAYVDLTLTCVKCHKYVRETRMTRRD